MRQVLQFVLRGYKRFVSPMLPNACRFVPTCSEYAMEAIERHGAFRGSLMAAGRLARCHPFCRAGYDPVPGVNRVDCVHNHAGQDLRPFAGGVK